MPLASQENGNPRVPKISVAQEDSTEDEEDLHYGREDLPMDGIVPENYFTDDDQFARDVLPEDR